MIARMALFGVLLLAAAPSPAVASEDGQVWTTFTANGPVAGHFAIWTEVQTRFGDDVSRLIQDTYRFGIGYAPRQDVAFYAGYARINNHRAGPDLNENRIWTQANYPLGRIGAVQMLGRTRLENRQAEHFDDTGWRVRQQLRALLPVHNSQVRLFAAGELLWNLNRTDWGARTGMDQFRTSFGVSVPLRPHLALDLGYLNQLQRKAGPDQMNHVATTTLTWRFGR